MEQSWKLKRTKQCKNCPWKVSVNPFDIPHGYDVQKHRDLIKTIASGDLMIMLNQKDMQIMSCHHSTPEDEEHCVGWLHNQLGVGNNIPLRFSMLSCENVDQIEVFGEQHDKFEDTLPENKGFTGPTEQE